MVPEWRRPRSGALFGGEVMIPCSASVARSVLCIGGLLANLIDPLWWYERLTVRAPSLDDRISKPFIIQIRMLKHQNLKAPFNLVDEPKQDIKNPGQRSVIIVVKRL